MSLLTAVAVDCIIPRNSYKTLRFQIVDFDTGEWYSLVDHEVIMTVGADEVLVKSGNIFNASNGQVAFEFEPDDTKDLLARSYHADILIRDANSKLYWSGWSGTIAVVPFLSGEVENNE